ncbi:MAG: hypothetical protein ACR2GH_18900, partial [Pseudonocardia sp.]
MSAGAAGPAAAFAAGRGRDVDPPVTGVEGGRWHGVERVYPPRAADTGECGRALCGALVRVAVRVGVFDPDRVPGPTCL